MIAWSLSMSSGPQWCRSLQGNSMQGWLNASPRRDGMYLLPEQVAEYDRKRMKVKDVLALQLVVTDEASAIQWLKHQLTRKP